MRRLSLETMFLLTVATVGNVIRQHDLPPGSNNLFDFIQKHFPVSEKKELLPKHVSQHN